MLRKLFAGLAMMAFLFLSFNAYSDSPKTLKPGDHWKSFKHQGRERTYLVHYPNSLKGKKNVPVVLAFHGGGTNAKWMPAYTDLNQVADKRGFVVVYPNGTGRTRKLLMWNAGSCCLYAKDNNIDDVGMVRKMIKRLEKEIPLDKKRIYAAGISNGGMMAYRLACELSDKIAAVGCVAGSLETRNCSPSRPVPVIHIHGTKDKMVKWDGGVGERSISKTNFKSVDYTVSQWVSHNGCKGKGSVSDIKDSIKNDGTRSTVKTWSKCRKNASVVLVRINGGGHNWPGFRLKDGSRFGKASRDFSASEKMWEFFKNHPMK